MRKTGAPDWSAKTEEERHQEQANLELEAARAMGVSLRSIRAAKMTGVQPSRNSSDLGNTALDFSAQNTALSSYRPTEAPQVRRPLILYSNFSADSGYATEASSIDGGGDVALAMAQSLDPASYTARPIAPGWSTEQILRGEHGHAEEPASKRQKTIPHVASRRDGDATPSNGTKYDPIRGSYLHTRIFDSVPAPLSTTNSMDNERTTSNTTEILRSQEGAEAQRFDPNESNVPTWASQRNDYAGNADLGYSANTTHAAADEDLFSFFNLDEMSVHWEPFVYPEYPVSFNSQD